MTELLVHCDGCGVRVQAERTRLTVECGPLRAWTEAIDLCPACAGRLRNQLDVGLPEGPAEVLTSAPAMGAKS